MANSTLQAIQTKVRRLTRTPSESQLSEAQLNEYINTFVLYDFPEHLRLFNFRTTFNFWTNPYQDRYPLGGNEDYGGLLPLPDTTLAIPGAANNPLFNFVNKYISVHPPLYIAGFQSFYSQSEQQFYGIYPKVNSIASIGTTGNGVATQFQGTINTNGAIIPPNLVQQTCLLQEQVLFSSVDVNFNGLAMVDVPILDSTTGNPTVWGALYSQTNLPATPLALAAPYNTDPNFPLTNFVNYSSGAFVVTFPTAPRSGALINSQTVNQVLARPQALLFYDNSFWVRPVPDQPYRVEFEVYVRPTEFMNDDQQPLLQEWWQYIAYGAAKKVFEDRMDIESVQMIMPEFKKQEALIQRRTIVQNTNQRTATIYTEQDNFGPGMSGWGWGSGF